jgi:hypothetical protein
MVATMAKTTTPKGTKNPAAKLLCWQAMRCLRTFTIRRLVMVTELPERTVYDYVKALLTVGYVRQESAYDPQGERGNAAQYRLVKDTGLYAPLVRQGTVMDWNAHPRQRDANSRMWQGLCEMRVVDAPHLASVARQRVVTASRYLKFLADHEFVVVIDPNQNGKAGSWTTYRLVGDPGPLPPMRRRDGTLLDLNKLTQRVKERCHD